MRRKSLPLIDLSVTLIALLVFFADISGSPG
jgi:hypothetical protein